MDSTGVNFYQINSYCNGNSSSIVLQRFCDIPFTTFRAAPFNLQQDSLIQSKLAATNAIGTGAFSSLNTVGVTIEVEPLSPTNAPVCVNYTEAYAEVNLPPLTGSLTGSASILFYELSWDHGTNGATWSTYTVTSSL